MTAISTTAIAHPALSRRRHHVSSRARSRGHVASDRILLVPSVGGWSLVKADGEVIARREGTGARHACLEYARATGIPALMS